MCLQKSTVQAGAAQPSARVSTHRIAEVSQAGQSLHRLGALQREGTGLRQCLAQAGCACRYPSEATGHRRPCGTDPQVQAEAPSPCEHHGQSQHHGCFLHQLYAGLWPRSQREATAGLPHPACLAAAAWLAGPGQHRAQSSPCLATLLPHALGCRPGQSLLLSPLASPVSREAGGLQCSVPAPWLQEVHGAPLLPTLSTPGVLSRTPSTSAAQTLAQLFYGIKSTWESASPALRQSAQGTGLHAQRCPPNRLLAWLGCACAMGLFEVPSYFLSQAGLRQAETGTGSWALGQGGIATLCWRHQECRGVWGATGLLTPLAAWGTGFWWG